MKKSRIWLALLLVPTCLLIWSCGDDNDTEKNYYYNDEQVTEYIYDTDSPALAQYFDTVREKALGLEDHTVYRPKDLYKFAPNSIPVVVWANGGCRNSNYSFTFISTAAASHGFIVIANGDPDSPTVYEDSTHSPQKQWDAMDWLESEEGQSQLLGRADLSKIAVAGQSCGGVETLVAAADSRVATVMAVNTGIFPVSDDGTCRLGFCPEELYNIHTPTLIVDGGEDDVAYPQARMNFEVIAEEVGIPVYLAEATHAGHTGLWMGSYDGNAESQMMTQGEWIYVNWLDFILNGNATAKAYFFDTNDGEEIEPWANPSEGVSAWYEPIWNEANIEDPAEENPAGIMGDGLPMWNYFYAGWEAFTDKLIEE